MAGEGEGDFEAPKPLTPPRVVRPDKWRLQARPSRSEPLPDGLENRALPAFVAQAAASLPQEVWQAICRHVSKQPSGPITLTVGTACSGSEFYLTALPHIAEEVSRRLGRDFRFDHRWSCEFDPRKRQWIMDNFAPKKLFGDITKLALGRCHDYVSGEVSTVDEVDLIIAGTSCKDASRLNPHHACRRNVVDTGGHTTGSTFQGLVALVAKFGPRCRMIFLENVVTLRDVDPDTGRSNFDGVREAVQALGFGFIAMDFSARDMGLPVARPRLYMAGVRCRDEAEAQRMAEGIVATISRKARAVSLDDLLLPEGEAYAQMRDWMREGLARQGEQPTILEQGLWHGKHTGPWEEIPPSVAEDVVPPLMANPWVRTLPARQRDLLLLSLCRLRLARRQPAAVPLHTSLGWEHIGDVEALPTLVPSGVFWLVARRRLLLGVEAVRLQGCDASSLPGLRPESHDSSFLMNLAGNAFCVYQFCAWLFAALASGDLAGQS